MAYSVVIKIRPTNLTDLTVTADLHTYTLDDFSEVDGWLEGGVRYVSNSQPITISSTGYETQTIIASELVANNEVTLVAEMQEVEILSDGTNNYQISDKVARAELLNKADKSEIPTNNNQLTNGAGYITGINSSDVTAALGYTPANDSNTVHKTGDETISGIKTFTRQITKTNNTAGVDTIFVNKNTAITKGTAPSVSVESRWRLTDSSSGDSNSALIAGVNFGYNISMRTSALVQVGKPEAGSTDTAAIGIYYPATGDAYTSAPTPATSDSSTKIATTAYVKNQGYVDTSSTQTIGGVKTLTSTLKSNDTYFLVNQLSISRTETPSSTINRYIEVVDKNGTGAGQSYGRLQFSVDTDKLVSTELFAFKAQENNKYDNIKIGVYYPATGDPYTYAPTPAASDSSTKIATTAFVNNWIKAISGYDATKTQTLKNVNGTLKWVTD